MLCGENVNFAVPQRIRETGRPATFFLRVKAPKKKAKLTACAGDQVLYEKTCRFVAPPEMLTLDVENCGAGELEISVREVEGK